MGIMNSKIIIEHERRPAKYKNKNVLFYGVFFNNNIFDYGGAIIEKEDGSLDAVSLKDVTLLDSDVEFSQYSFTRKDDKRG